MCELGKSLKESQQIADDELERIWVKRENGIASVGQGFMYKKEFSANREYLSSVTLDVINDPSQATYDRLHNEWRTEGDFGRTLWSVIRRVFALADPEHLTSIVGDEYLDFIFTLLNEQFELGISRSKHWFNDNASLIEATSPLIPNDINFIRRNILLWLLYEYSQPSKSNLSDNGTDNTANSVAESTVGKYEGTAMTASLNQILYGPPGTGKTYHSIQAAVKAAEPEMFSALGIDERIGTTLEQRVELTRLYKELYNAGRIRFVTFHQSYGYEEFVEGLRPTTDSESSKNKNGCKHF
jgi:5-methylcytosine-specific restriction protein B